jgi:hypothetical protein
MKRKSKLLLLLTILLTLTITSFAQGAVGDLLWSKSFNFLPVYNRVSASTAFSSSTCIINGAAMNSSTGHSIGFIKVYDIDTGDLKWDRTLTLGDSNWFNVSLNGNLVYITGFSQSWTDFSTSPRLSVISHRNSKSTYLLKPSLPLSLPLDPTSPEGFPAGAGRPEL